MTLSKFDKYIDSKFGKSEIKSPSVGFTRLLMDKIQTDFAIEAEIRKNDRVANYIIGFFASLMGIITVTAGYFYFSTKAEEVSRFNNYFYSGSETSMNYFEKFTNFIQTLFLKITNVLGFNQTSNSVNIIVLLIILSSLYLLADRIFLKRKLKSHRI